MEEHGIENGYQLFKAAKGQLTEGKAYYLVNKKGDVSRLDLDTVAGLLVAFSLSVEQASQLFAVAGKGTKGAQKGSVHRSQ
jgi:hypothetical protein